MVDFSNPRAGIAVAMIIIYTIAFIFSLAHIIRFGYKKTPGWIPILIFSVLRIAAGAVDLVILSSSTTPSVGYIIAESILLNIGLGPLLKAGSLFLKRVLRENEPYVGSLFHPRMERLLDGFILIGIILSIVGSSLLSNTDGKSSNLQTAEDLMKASSLIFLVAVLFLLGAAIFTAMRLSTAPVANTRAYIVGVLLAGPFFIVRVSYSIGSAFNLSHADNKFNSLTGDWKIYLAMMFIMEMAIVIIFCVSGFMAEKRSKLLDREANAGEDNSTHEFVTMK